jgi:hypothetical protein
VRSGKAEEIWTQIGRTSRRLLRQPQVRLEGLTGAVWRFRTPGHVGCAASPTADCGTISPLRSSNSALGSRLSRPLRCPSRNTSGWRHSTPATASKSGPTRCLTGSLMFPSRKRSRRNLGRRSGCQVGNVASSRRQGLATTRAALQTCGGSAPSCLSDSSRTRRAIRAARAWLMPWSSRNSTSTLSDTVAA